MGYNQLTNWLLTSMDTLVVSVVFHFDSFLLVLWLGGVSLIPEAPGHDVGLSRFIGPVAQCEMWRLRVEL